MIYFLVTFLVLVAALLVLRLRLRLEISSDRRLLFIGLGRSGPEFDFGRKRGFLKLFGLKIKQFQTGERKSKKRADEFEKKPKTDKKRLKPKRRRSVKDIVAIAPQCLKALGKYSLGLLQTAIVEQAEAEIEAGFESPALTGQLFGYYQAALAAVPGLGRVQYIPDWNGQSFAGSAQFAVAWPLYMVVWQTTLLVFRLPVRKIIRVSIGTKEGGQDG